MEYTENREKLYGSLRSVFSWDWLDGMEYALAEVHAISPDLRQELAFATEALGQIYAKTVAFTQLGSDDLLKELGIPEEALGAVRVFVFPEWVTTVGRFDFAHTRDGLKMLEFNADTPTSVVEAFYVNGKACDFFGFRDPNLGMEKHIFDAFAQTLGRYNEFGFATDSIVFSSLGWHNEDRGTTEYLLQKSGLKGRFVPLENLRIDNDRLWAIVEEEKVPVDVLYRLHALEKLAVEKDDTDGYPTGAHVLDLIARGKLAVINPPSAFVAQTKALQALIWGLHEAEEFFSTAEHDIIEKYMLPTYLENLFLDRVPYVTKPIYGREGGAVRIFTASGEILESDKDDYYWEQPMVYQKYAEMEEVESQTVSGTYKGRLLWGSFLVGGRASAIAARIGERITGNLSCFLPVGYK
ncbi:MAG: glutathionylspermidine synthase family protein [Desulfitobacteriaceae bacterium]